MANNENETCSFTDFPEDIQVSILSFLGPSEIATLACTSKKLGSLCSTVSKLWFSMCERRWGSNTRITQWAQKPAISFKQLYHTLHRWENLLGFWRRSGTGIPSLLFFEWGPSFISASRVSPSDSDSNTYGVTKTPFLWMSLSEEGHVVTFLDPDGRRSDFKPENRSELVAVDVSFMGKTHFVVEEKRVRGGDDDVVVAESGSPPERLMAEIYQHFANPRSPGSDRSRRQRRREKERLYGRKWEPQHFVKIVNCSPTPARPLQGLWKGICGDMSLAFYLVAYDDIGGIACRWIGDPPDHFSGQAPVFWTSNATFLESPFSPEEESLYDSRVHLRPLQLGNEQFQLSGNVVNRIHHISSSYDLVVPDLAGTMNRRSAEGRIWQYQNGTFGFGFLSDNFVIDMKHIVHNGCIVDTVNSSAN
ncbi:hypothetical protein JHK87_039196 [Glycine soja]|nr:hypothetical protein JHK87_039196 [Glycine soja]